MSTPANADVNLFDLFGQDAAEEIQDLDRKPEGSDLPEWNERYFEPEPTADKTQSFKLRFVKNPFLHAAEGITYPAIYDQEQYRFKNRDGHTRIYTTLKSLNPKHVCPVIGCYAKTKGEDPVKMTAREYMKKHLKWKKKTVAVVQVMTAPPEKKSYIGRFMPAQLQQKQLTDVKLMLNPTQDMIDSGAVSGAVNVFDPGSAPLYLLNAAKNAQGRTYDGSRFLDSQYGGLLVEESILIENSYDISGLKATEGLTTNEAGQQVPVNYYLITIEKTDDAELRQLKMKVLIQKLQQLNDPAFHFYRPLGAEDQADLDVLIQEIHDLADGKQINARPDPAAAPPADSASANGTTGADASTTATTADATPTVDSAIANITPATAVNGADNVPASNVEEYDALAEQLLSGNATE